jgi:hypothetical protein
MRAVMRPPRPALFLERTLLLLPLRNLKNEQEKESFSVQYFVIRSAARA